MSENPNHAAREAMLCAKQARAYANEAGTLRATLGEQWSDSTAIYWARKQRRLECKVTKLIGRGWTVGSGWPAPELPKFEVDYNATEHKGMLFIGTYDGKHTEFDAYYVPVPTPGVIGTLWNSKIVVVKLDGSGVYDLSWRREPFASMFRDAVARGFVLASTQHAVSEFDKLRSELRAARETTIAAEGTP